MYDNCIKFQNGEMITEKPKEKCEGAVVKAEEAYLKFSLLTDDDAKAEISGVEPREQIMTEIPKVDFYDLNPSETDAVPTAEY